jgi:LysM repeat protein
MKNWATIADVVFAGLASADQNRGTNGLTQEDPDALLDAGQLLVIPFPCVCFNSTDNNLPAVYLSYVVRVGDTVESIAAGHDTTVTDLSNVNAMGSPIVAPGDILAIPLPGKIISHNNTVTSGFRYGTGAMPCYSINDLPFSLNRSLPQNLTTLTGPHYLTTNFGTT